MKFKGFLYYTKNIYNTTKNIKRMLNKRRIINIFVENRISRINNNKG